MLRFTERKGRPRIRPPEPSAGVEETRILINRLVDIAHAFYARQPSSQYAAGSGEIPTAGGRGSGPGC